MALPQTGTTHSGIHESGTGKYFGTNYNLWPVKKGKVIQQTD